MLNPLLISITLCTPLVLCTLLQSPNRDVLSRSYDYIIVGGTSIVGIALRTV